MIIIYKNKRGQIVWAETEVNTPLGSRRQRTFIGPKGGYVDVLYNIEQLIYDEPRYKPTAVVCREFKRERRHR